MTRFVWIALVACGPSVTYRQDIAPLVEAQCLGCHTADGVAGLDLSTHAALVANATLVKGMTATRRMPPYLVDPSGACGELAPGGYLSDEEIARIGEWVDAGAPEGRGEIVRASMQTAALTDATTLDMAEPYTPAAVRNDDYRCFVIDPALATDRFLSAYEVHPGDTRVVHHVILFALDTAAADKEADQNDAADPGYGYQCFGGSRVSASRPVAAWAPGTRQVRYPDGTGVRLLAGRKLVMQVHYNLHQGVIADRSRIELELQPAIANEAIAALIADTSVVLPPGQADTGTELSIRLGDLGVPVGIFIRGVYPHMHTTGTSMRFELEHEGETRCLASVPRWDFGHQQFFFFANPIYVYPQDTLRIRCRYDTSERTTTTTWGEGTDDEMCLMGAYVTLF